MKIDVISLDNKKVGSVDLADEIFGLTPRGDILARVVHWQLAKRRAGTHATKQFAEVSGTGKKPFKQKHTGNARQGTLRGPHMRGGYVALGPQPRDYEYSLQKKVRALGLKMAVSAKARDAGLVILESEKLETPKTAEVAAKIEKIAGSSALIVGGKDLDKNFVLSVKNVIGVDALPSVGINVYDILKHEKLVLTMSAVKDLEARFING